MKKISLLIDTNVIIDYLRNNAQAADYLENLSASIVLSTISVAEIYAGIRNGAEEQTVENLLRTMIILPVDHAIASVGGSFCKKYKNSHGVGLADALIAATAQQHEAILVTLNTKHFPMVKTVKPYNK
ncbi:MAG TPA: type II toxin-antitoxin system VapC family toxin [Coxiellaceae bacterium]|nr:MAG: hypothetical protein A3E81_07070 [Gammaproteobacteria bacterium RIFCSPHIGHO2_12_FULL_36_30]HLB56413.1 type II toxin-antitoxin system VapC family toxin [Coxiellaceae bacterium]